MASLTESIGVALDNDTTSDFQKIMDEEDGKVKQLYPEGSFQQIFWEQQKEASSRTGKGRRWHPLMIKWCIFLRHQSSKAYEMLRQCIHLPSQRTLRDYTNCIKAKAGFSAEVDQQLIEAAHSESSPEWQRLIFLLLDEMYIREDLVYNKHSGQMIGYANIGDINLLAFERSIQNDIHEEQPIAKTMMAFMVRGVFTPLRFPYAHFPCKQVTGELLFQPFWEAVYRLERMGLKVNRSLISSISGCIIIIIT